MPQLTPIQQSFSAGEISPLMYMRSDSEGYQQGVSELTNMFPDSRGAAYTRGGMRHVSEFAGDDARIIPIPVNDLFFYVGIFTESLLTITTSAGHVPAISYSGNSNFNDYGANWVSDTDGHATSKVNFLQGAAVLEVDDKNNRYAYVSQEVTLPATGIFTLLWGFAGNAPIHLKVGLTEDSDEMYSTIHPSGRETAQFTATSTTVWVTARLDSDNDDELYAYLGYIGISDENPTAVEFVTPYAEVDLEELQYAQSPSGSALYVLHEKYPPYKLVYDNAGDSFTWTIVTFTDPPAVWTDGSYPSCGDFFQGRLWLGGTVNEPQTFWASQSADPENFGVSDPQVESDSLEFTMAKYGRIEWMVGFKNLVIGTQNGEHIVSSVGDYISPLDIQVQQQSAYGSAGVQPVQVGDQIFYVSADNRKLRAIQYEWQKDNWLSQDLTFNSEHITESGIKHITWQQNPRNLFHCVLNNGKTASMTYERGHNIYGWARVESQGTILDATTAPIQGTDLANLLVRYKDGVIAYENQSISQNMEYMDSWVLRHPEADGVTVSGLEHLEGFDCQVTVKDGTHPNRTVSGGQITLQHEYAEEDKVVVGLGYTPKLVTLPFDKGAPSGGSGAGWEKRWNKIYARIYNSFPPLINGERTPERYSSTPMGTPQPNVNEEILKVNLGFDRHALITIEQDLPRSLTVLGVFGELSQSKT